ncbi:MAG: RNA 2',3'-cyclic phosphodiesterase [Candidatus Brocadiae bacterium]|nr:RNA 2',3'-cyclic phosphodiesterase [Candidatus Brocadiia bacterium]
MKIRTFIAIPLDQEIKEKITQFQEELKKEIVKGIKWVEAESLHLTLKFLGDVEESQIDSISQAMNLLLDKHPVFSFKISGLGIFPPHGLPNVIWAGITTAKDTLRSLSHSLDQEMQKFGVPLEGKEFSPHITLGRAKKGAEIQGDYQKILAEHSALPFGEQQVKSIILFKSDLQPKGPVYTPLYNLSLG